MVSNRRAVPLVRFVVAALWLAVAVLCAAPAAANPQPGLPPRPPGIDLSTPRRAMRFFLDTTRDGDFARAAYALDLRELPRAEQAAEGASLSRELRYVLARKLWIDVGGLSDEPGGDRSDGLLTETVGKVGLRGAEVPIKLTRVPLADGSAEWVVSQETIRAIPDLYEEHGPGIIGEQLPQWAHRSRVLQLPAWQWIGLGAALLVAVPAAFLITAALLGLLGRLARQTKSQWDDYLVRDSYGPLRAFLALALFGAFSRSLKLPMTFQASFEKLAGSLIIASVAWFIMRAVGAVTEALAEQLTANQPDPVIVQGTRTRLDVTRRIVNSVVGLVAGALALTQFDVVRRVGLSVLASAGIIGIALGFAAQKVLGNLLAGLQLSLAQPVRIGDRVLIEGQFGFVEEIGLTYVVIKTWDRRRLVLPITQLVEKSFENWTRTSRQLIGAIEIHADYRLPVERLREWFLEAVKKDPDWDGEVANLQVTGATTQTILIRCLVSGDAAVVFDIRCRLREQIIAYLQELDGGRYLPRTRVELPDKAS